MKDGGAGQARHGGWMPDSVATAVDDPATGFAAAGVLRCRFWAAGASLDACGGKRAVSGELQGYLTSLLSHPESA